MNFENLIKIAEVGAISYLVLKFLGIICLCVALYFFIKEKD
jgi:hypothetical protein